MTISAVLPVLVVSLVLFPFGASYSFNVDTDLTSSNKMTFTVGSEFGSSFDAGQDFNNDGFNDILVAAQSYSRAYVYFGGGDSIPASPSVTFTTTTGGQLSQGYSYAGDVNNDGFADIIMSAPNDNSGPKVYLILGASTTTSPYSVNTANSRTIIYTPESMAGATPQFGRSVSAAGDVNNDNFDDFVICAPGMNVGSIVRAGACYLIYGGNNLHSLGMSSLGSGGIKITGSTASQNFGTVVRGVGDMNKDGYDDLLINNGDYSNVYLIYGGGSLTSFTTGGLFSGVIFPKPSTVGSKDYFGGALASAGDFNNDGFVDLMIGTGGYSITSPGNIFVVFGGSSLPSIFDLAALTSSTGVRYFSVGSDSAGFAIAGGVDYNLDGFDDIIIGATGAYQRVGAAFVVFGSASPVDSSVYNLGDGGISLTGAVHSQTAFGDAVGLTAGVNTNGPGILGRFSPSYGSYSVYYLHDLLSTAAPSVSPTVVPTNSPSVSPTTMVPTVEPTMTPTVSPTTPPTFPPTVASSFVPSVSPTMGPSATPTINPSFVPSVDPTMAPTTVPTANPSFAPSVDPTMAPTTVPTANPSFVPSARPTVEPTAIPTPNPTVVPSVDPTMAPTAVPTIAPSFRPSAPTYSPSAVPTAVPTGRSKSSIVISTGFTVNSVNGATLTPTSQATIKQSIANVSQTTVNNVDLVSVTRTNRRLLSSVLHRMLESVSLFSYNVVAEIHFNLIDFPGLNESYVAGTESKSLMQSMESHEFDRIISYFAAINNASQLMSNVTVRGTSVTFTVVPVPSESEQDPDLSDGQVAGLVVGITLGTVFLGVVIYIILLKVRSKPSSRGQVADYNEVPVVTEVESALDIAQVYQERTDNNLERSLTSSSQIQI
jgi:hypothetical protein